MRMRPDDTLVRRALISDSVNGCDSVGPTVESHCHSLLSQNFDSEGHASHVVSMFGNSAARLHSSAPCMTTEAQVFVAPSRAYENSSSLNAEGSDAVISSIALQVHAPSIPPQNCPRTSVAPHLCLPRSMAPHLRVLRKISKVHSTNMPEAHYSSAATMVPVICKPPLFGITQKGHGVHTSSMMCTTPNVVLHGPDHPAKLADTERNAPSLSMLLETYLLLQYCRFTYLVHLIKLFQWFCAVNGALRREVQVQRPNQGVDASSIITQAADTLVALSAHGEKGW